MYVICYYLQSSVYGDILKIMKPEEKGIANMRSAGATMQTIADTLDMSIGKVHRICHKEDVAALIESEYNQFISCLPKARQNIQSLIERHDNLPDDSKDKQRAWASSMEMLRSAGMLPGNPSQLTINNIQINQQQIISPVISDLIGRFSQDDSST